MTQPRSCACIQRTVWSKGSMLPCGLRSTVYRSQDAGATLTSIDGRTGKDGLRAHNGASLSH